MTRVSGGLFLKAGPSYVGWAQYLLQAKFSLVQPGTQSVLARTAHTRTHGHTHILEKDKQANNTVAVELDLLLTDYLLVYFSKNEFSSGGGIFM